MRKNVVIRIENSADEEENDEELEA